MRVRSREKPDVLIPLVLSAQVGTSRRKKVLRAQGTLRASLRVDASAGTFRTSCYYRRNFRELFRTCNSNKVATHPLNTLNYDRSRRRAVAPCAIARARRFSSNNSNTSFGWVCVSKPPRRVCTSSRKTCARRSLTHSCMSATKRKSTMTTRRARATQSARRRTARVSRAGRVAHVLCTSISSRDTL